MVKKFTDFGISSGSDGLIGTKVAMSYVLNREITVHSFKMAPSKHPDKSANGQCLYMQISIGETKHVLFSGSGILADQIRQIPSDGFPFTVTIVKENDWFKFT